jgi:hypothetical protein
MSISNPAFRPIQDARWADLQRLRTSSPMYDAVIEEVNGRRIRIGDRWLADFASCKLPGLRPRAGDHRLGRCQYQDVGDAPELVTTAGQPACIST